MAPRYSIWMLLAGVAVGLIVGYVAGRGVFDGSRSGSSPASEVVPRGENE
ncbi:MAG: hypothetical protein MK194_07605 [Roseibacillus sp.]|nr:hypothetical protein [Roseibacillus sp.]